jgi:hypothetical protein
VKHEVKVAIEVEDDALADAPHGLDPPAMDLAERRIERAHQKRARHAHLSELLADDPAAQVQQVNLDVGQLGHGGHRVAREPRSGAELHPQERTEEYLGARGQVVPG